MLRRGRGRLYRVSGLYKPFLYKPFLYKPSLFVSKTTPREKLRAHWVAARHC